MKKSFLFKLLAVPALATAMIGCSKEEISAPGTTASTVSTEKPGGSPDVQNTGFVIGSIGNPAKSMSVMLANGQNSYGPIYLDPNTSNFKIGNVQPGIYKLMIAVVGSGFTAEPGLTMEVEVRAGVVTDLGVLNL